MNDIRETHAALAIKRTMGVRREEYLDYMTFRRNQRTLFTEVFGPLAGLREEWAQQGATPEELDFSAFRFRSPILASVPVHTGWIGGPETTILEETADYVIALDKMGRKMKLSKKASTLPLPMDHPVKDRDTWLAVKEHYAFSEERFEEGWEAAAQRAREEGKVVVAKIPGGFDELRQLMGEEQLCISFYTQPDLIGEMLETIGDVAHRTLDRVTSRVAVDQLNIHEDMAGKNGPLIGPKQVDAYIVPYYRRLWDLVSARGVRLFYQDSDGDMTKLIPSFLEAGLNVMGPVEPVGGNDIVKLREHYGSRLAFQGGIDKHVLRKDQAAITAELEYKIPPMVRTGGCILGIDHRIPNGTPLANYRFYIEKSWDIIEREEAKR